MVILVGWLHNADSTSANSVRPRVTKTMRIRPVNLPFITTMHNVERRNNSLLFLEACRRAARPRIIGSSC